MMPADLTLFIKHGNERGVQRWNIRIMNGLATWFIDGTMYGQNKPKESVIHHFDALLPSLLESDQRQILVALVAKS